MDVRRPLGGELCRVGAFFLRTDAHMAPATAAIMGRRGRVGSTTRKGAPGWGVGAAGRRGARLLPSFFHTSTPWPRKAPRPSWCDSAGPADWGPRARGRKGGAETAGKTAMQQRRLGERRKMDHVVLLGDVAGREQRRQDQRRGLSACASRRSDLSGLKGCEDT